MSKEVSVHQPPPAASYSLEQMQRMAQNLVKAPGPFKDVDQTITLLLLAQAEGKHPILVARDYNIIQGTPAKKAEAMMRDFQATGGKIRWHKLDDTIADATFSHPQGGEMRMTWDIPRAERAGLAQKDNWKRYPRSMLRSRCVSEGVRALWPGATSGLYTEEEVRDIEPEKDITPPATPGAMEAAVTQAVQDGATALTQEEVEAHIDAMDVKTLPDLQRAFEAAWTHARKANDKRAQARFKEVYDICKAALPNDSAELI